jgi:O-antigen ligase
VSTIFYAALILFTIYFAIVNKVKPNFQSFNLVLILLFALMVLSYTWTINKDLTLIGIGRKSAFLIAPIMFAFIPNFKTIDIKYIFRYFSYVMGIYAIFFIGMGLFHYLTTGSLSNLTHHELVSPLDLNRIYVSLLTVVAIFHILYNEKSSRTNVVLLGLLFIFLVLLSSKTIILTALLLLAILGFRIKIPLVKNKKIFIAVLILVLGFGFLKFNPRFYSELIPAKYSEVLTKNDFEKNYYFNGSELRILYTRFLYEFEKEQNIFFTGFGLNASQEKLNEKCIQYRVPDGYGVEFNFHNQYNQIFAEIGIFGLLLLLSIFYLGLRKAFKATDRFSIAVLLMFASLFLTESVLNRQMGIYFFIFVYVVLSKSTNKEPINDKKDLKVLT